MARDHHPEKLPVLDLGEFDKPASRKAFLDHLRETAHGVAQVSV
jgi:hypothetical protein